MGGLPPVPPRRDLQPRSVALTGIAGAAIAIGSLLPWATVTTPFGTIDVAGTHGDGQITVILGIVLLAVAFLQWTGGRIAWFHRAWFPTLLLGGAAAAISGYDMVNLSNRIGEVASGLVHAASVSGSISWWAAASWVSWPR